MWTDLRLALRALVRSPAFAVTAIAALALGIGANTAVFGLVNTLLLNPPGISAPDRVVAVRARYDKLRMPSISVSAPDFADVRDARTTFEHTAVVRSGAFNLTGAGLPERLQGASVSREWFEVFGAKPLLGRLFTAAEDEPENNFSVILSHATWTRLFGQDPTVLSRSLQLNGRAYRIVGVMDPEFRWPQRTDLWAPLGLPAGAFEESSRFSEYLTAAALLKPGVSLDEANAVIRVLADRVRQQQTEGAAFARDSAWGMFVISMADFTVGDSRTPVLVLLGAVGFVLLIACANLAGLMLARAAHRTRDTAMRAALGAGTWRLLRQTLAESLVLATAGGLAGLAVAASGTRLLLTLAPEGTLPASASRFDWRVLAFTAAVTVAAAMLSGLAPAFHVSRTSGHDVLKAGGRSTGSRHRLRSLLVVSETALALVLLVGAGLFLRSLAHLQEVSPGFDSSSVMTAAVMLPAESYRDGARQTAFHHAIMDRLSSAPGVSAAAAVQPLPFSGDNSAASFSIEGRAAGPGDPGPHGDVRLVTPEYFEVMRIPLRRGRVFIGADHEQSQPVAIVDETLAHQYWPGQDPIGRHIRNGGPDTPWATVVGVVGHVRHSSLAGDAGTGTYYYPLFQRPARSATLVVRTTKQPTLLAATIREAVRAVDPALPVFRVRPMDELVASSLATRRFVMQLLGCFAVVALALAALGLYGLISYSVAQRTKEIGVRMALGAPTVSVLRLIVGQGFRLALVGTLVGLVAAAAAGRLLSNELPGVGALDPLTFGVTAAVLLAAALTASYVPARRAAKVDPLRALRTE